MPRPLLCFSYLLPLTLESFPYRVKEKSMGKGDKREPVCQFEWILGIPDKDGHLIVVCRSMEGWKNIKGRKAWRLGLGGTA